MQKKILFKIVFAQFACTSVWFAVNAVMPQLVEAYTISENSVGFFTSVIQFGFIIGTLFFAFFGIVDRYNPTKIFMLCALISALSNFALLFPLNNYSSISILRFITGICLAGIYPVGIKIAADHFKNGLGKALGFLVGTLVLGTAIPHFFNYIALKNSLQIVIGLTSSLSVLGALIIGLGISNEKSNTNTTVFKPKVITQLFSDLKLRSAAFGYFGHMWELYTFWAFTPIFIKLYNNINNASLNSSLWSFIIISVGFFSCIFGGFLAAKYSSQWVAKYSLLGSLICCILFPFSLHLPSILFLFLLIIWGILVIADSPQLSTLVAQSAPAAYKGSAITIVNCIGFSLTIVSIQLLSSFSNIATSPYIYLILAIGPLFGFYHLRLKNN